MQRQQNISSIVFLLISCQKNMLLDWEFVMQKLNNI
jgi:hypothetical protein